jgi:chromosome segregation ATPase
MEDSTLEMIVYIMAGFAIGFVICFSGLRQRYLSKYKKSIRELKAKYAGDVSQSVLFSKKLFEAEEKGEVLIGELEAKHSTIEILEQQLRENSQRVTRLEADLVASQAQMKEHEAELKNYQERLKINRNDLKYTTTLEERLATLTNNFELELRHKETEIKNLQLRLEDVERARNLLLEDLKTEDQSASREARSGEAQAAEMQELREMVRHLIVEHGGIDDPENRALVDEALGETRAAYQRAMLEKEVEIAQLLEYISGAESHNAAAAKQNARLREFEALYEALQANYQALHSEKAASDVELAAKTAEIAELLERVSFIGTLRKQYADKEAELQTLEEKFQTAMNNKNLEIHFLQERFDNLEKLHATALAEKESEIRELQTRTAEFSQPQAADFPASYQTLLAAKDAEIADLLERSQALETLFAAHSEETDLKFKEKEAEISKAREDAEALEVFVAAHSQEIDARLQQKEAEIAELQACIVELESANFIPDELKKMEAQYQAVLQTKNSEIVRLQMRVNQLEPFSALVAQRDAHIRELDNRYQMAVSAKDAEIARLQSRLKELHGKVKMAC